MAEEVRHPDGRIEHPNVRYEPTDANAGRIFAILAAAVVFMVVVQVAVYAFFNGYGHHLAETGRSSYPLAPEPSTALPRKPRLEQLERLSGGDAANIYEREAATVRFLDSYGPAKSKGFLHIPISRAMQLLVKKNMLKARPEPPDDHRALGLVDAGATNSGRLLKGAAK